MGALIVSVGLFAAVETKTSTTTSTSYVTTTTTFTTSQTGNSSAVVPGAGAGLNLTLEVVKTSGGRLSINVQEVNELDSPVNVTQADGWPYAANDMDPYFVGGCGASGLVGFAMFQGYYGVSDYSSARALYLDTPEVYTCTSTSESTSPPTYYLFQSMGNLADVYQGGKYQYSSDISLTFSAAGYWTGSPLSTEGTTYHLFTPGIYTILAGDEWDDVAILHFTVSDSGTISVGVPS